jgi:hypothetical protein
MLNNGRYKSVAKLQPGDKLRAFDGPPSVVKLVEKKKTSFSDEIVTIKHDGWYLTTSCCSDQEILMFDPYVKKLFWTQVGEAGYYSEMFTLPPKIKATKDETDSSFQCAFELGFLMGAFLRIGGLNNFPEVTFVYNKKSQIEALLKKYTGELYRTTPIIREGETTNKMSFMNKYMWNMFSNVGVYEWRTLPDVFLRSDKLFAAGVNIGLIKSGFQGVPQIGSSMYEILYWSALNSDQMLCYSQKSVEYENQTYETCFGHVYLTNRGLFDVYNVELEANTTFIANNLVMRIP